MNKSKSFTRIIRVNTWDDDSVPQAGDISTLVRYIDWGSNRRWWALDDHPATNLSHEERRVGWLGDTNGISATAHGRVEVISVREHNARYAESARDRLSDVQFYSMRLRWTPSDA